jgi:hypothetical protein
MRTRLALLLKTLKAEMEGEFETGKRSCRLMLAYA